MGQKIILDTDIGFDADDLFALVFLKKLAGSQLALITTANEMEDKRLRFVNNVLDLFEDVNTIVASGESLGMDKFVVEELLVDGTMRAQTDYKEEMKKIIDENSSVVYIGIGGFTNLANFIEFYPEEAKKMKIFLMGGALDYEKRPGWIEYNIKIDPLSAEKVLRAGLSLTLVMAQTTHNPIYEVLPDGNLYKKLKESKDPINQLLRKHCDLWFKRNEFKFGTSMHDPLTVAAALGYDFVCFKTVKVKFMNGKFISDKDGYPICYSETKSKAGEFMSFLEKTLFESLSIK